LTSVLPSSTSNHVASSTINERDSNENLWKENQKDKFSSLSTDVGKGKKNKVVLPNQQAALFKCLAVVTEKNMVALFD